jgi:8-oxo-dGTP diphosphatase
VVAALLERPGAPGAYLVQQRLAHKTRGNLWEFPGGKVEPGESDESALARECREELEVEVSVGRQVWSTTHDYPDFSVNLLVYAATLLEGEPKALHAQALRFCRPEEMRALPFCEADEPLLEELARGGIQGSR